MEARRARNTLNFDLPDDQRWNHSIQYHRVLIAAIPPDATRVLDVGCGEGLLVRQLKAKIPALSITGIDPDQTSIERARNASPNATDITYICDDIRAHTFSAGSFDAVVSVNTIHHMDIAEALRRFSETDSPGRHHWDHWRSAPTVDPGQPLLCVDAPWTSLSDTSTRLGPRVTSPTPKRIRCGNPQGSSGGSPRSQVSTPGSSSLHHHVAQTHLSPTTYNERRLFRSVSRRMHQLLCTMHAYPQGCPAAGARLGRCSKVGSLHLEK